ncbi:triosephosphate isomerase [Hydrogenivirga caldilitoris]|uniref:Triosephosphate isomerase n=1 Tax=Hydrogenivirga caldilitoris TaxID=246264 RepID=A0A497XT27_9AQUI|nr:triose-phosphate isomerase [Hydrogenivirga caldilitoris]RLJ70282.1 triosephosphate isomerase [Hydrogenivirga caldilitoris]
MRLIAANWKMHKTVKETEEYIREFLKFVEHPESREILLCPPFTSLYVAGKLLEGSGVKLGAQNCYYEKQGAFTGEVSLPMLKEVGCEYVIIGHSERRYLFGENDELINKKLIACLEEGIRPILCVGEKLEDRETGMTFKVVETQVRLALSGLEEHTDGVDIAYEPVWAIGTGIPAMPEDAVSVHGFIKQLLNDINPKNKGKTRVLYGGSVKPENAGEYMKHSEIDGLLVGGASLNPETFAKIVYSF